MGRMKGVVLLAVLLVAGVATARGEVVGGTNVRVTFHGWLTPRELPRSVDAPVALHIKGALRTTNGGDPPSLRRVTIAINRHARISTAGLPACTRRILAASTSRQALAACGAALIGEGRFSAHIRIPEQSPFPARGKVLAFNGVSDGRHVVFAHVFGRDPIPTINVLTFGFQRSEQGTFGTVLSVQLPTLADDWGHVSGFDLELARRYRFRGRARSLVSARCPAPNGFRSASFTAARGTYYLSDGRQITRRVTGRCRVAAG